MLKLDLDKAEELEIKLPPSTESYVKQENSRNTSISCCIDYTKVFDCGSQQTVESS